MNLSNIAKIVSKETGEPAYKIEKILNISFKIIRQQIIKAQIIKLKNLLTIYVDVVPESKKYNLVEKKIVTLPKRFILKIQPSKKLKEEVNAKKTY